MLSDTLVAGRAGERPSAAARLLAVLRSQGLGVACGQATVVLLGIGSLVLVATGDGASRHVAMDDLRVFFAEPSPAHLWLYALLPVMGLYGLNTVLGTWDDVLAKWRAGHRSPRAYAAALVHVGFLFALLAHLVAGLGSEEEGALVIGSRWVDLG